MAAEDAMRIDERRAYLSLLRPQNVAASRAGRSAVVTRLEVVTRVHRKSLTRLLGPGDYRPHQPVLLLERQALRGGRRSREPARLHAHLREPRRSPLGR